MSDKRLLLGTRNPAKIVILRVALAALPVQVVTPDELGIDLDVAEEGQTTVENAELKARAYRDASGLSTLSIDGGLHIAGLPEDRQPGVHVRRIPGAHGQAGEQEITAYYAHELAALGGRRTGTWTGGVALALASGHVLCDSFTYRVILAAHPVAVPVPGAPLRALALDPASGRPYAELPIEERPDCRWLREFLARHLDEL